MNLPKIYRGWAWGSMLFPSVLALCIAPACSSASGPDTSADFSPIALAAGQTVRFERDYGQVEITYPGTARFRFSDGELHLSNGADEAMVRPLLPYLPQPQTLETYEKLLARHGTIPRMEELLADPSQIIEVLARYPMVPAIADSLPADLDPRHPWTRAAAYVASNAETKERTFLAAARAFVETGGSADDKARRATEVLRACPLVVADSVVLEAVDKENGDEQRIIWFQTVGGFRDDEGRRLRRVLSLPADYDVLEDWMEGVPLRTPDPLSLAEAHLFHKRLRLLLESGGSGEIDLSSGWRIHLEGASP